MANVDAAIRARLTANTTLLGLVSSRIYPDHAPQNATYPLIVQQCVGVTRDQSINSVPTGLSQARQQLTCWGATPASAKSVAELVRVQLDGYRGTSTNANIMGCSLEMEVGVMDLSADNEAARKYGRAMDFAIWFEESTT